MDARADLSRRARAQRGMYESFYLRAVSPDEPVGVWIRHTVHKRPGARRAARCGAPCSTPAADAPVHAQAHDRASSAFPAGGWIAVGGRQHRARRARGQLRRRALVAALLQRRSPSCATSPPSGSTARRCRAPSSRARRPRRASTAPSRSPDGAAIELGGWPGMVGHNWGSEHAERWIWLHGIGFAEAPDAWLDVALGRLLIAGRMTPWVANGVLCLDGRRHRLGGLGARGLSVQESAAGAHAPDSPGGAACRCALRVESPAGSAAGWRYADPDGGEHDVVNCSVAALELTVHDARQRRSRTPAQRARRRLRAGDARARPRRPDRAVPRRLSRLSASRAGARGYSQPRFPPTSSSCSTPV